MVANPYLSCEFHLKHFLDLIPTMFLEVVTTCRDASDFIRNTNFLENHVAPLFSPKFGWKYLLYPQSTQSQDFHTAKIAIQFKFSRNDLALKL